MQGSEPVATVLPANQPPRYYRGGTAIARFRGSEEALEYGPEDWIASTTTRFGTAGIGLSELPDGMPLRDAIERDPYGWLGSDHVERFGADPALLVKLLDAGQRVPVHCHPTDALAREYLESDAGRTEAWVVLGTESADPCVYVGFAEDVDETTLRGWVDEQDGEAMLAAMNRVPVAPGDSVFVPAGLPHAIGAGVFLTQLQQPTDHTVALEWRGYLDDTAAASLGIGFETALSCVDRTGWAERIDGIVHRDASDAPCRWLLNGEQERFFRAHRLSTARGVLLKAGYSVLIVLDGELRLIPEAGPELALRRGDTAVIPYASGAVEAIGEAVSLHCRPPAVGELG